jgi:hypothetical protein
MLALASASAYAQQTGGLTADNLFQYLSKQGNVTAKKVGSDALAVQTRDNGQASSIRFVDPQVVMITRPIAKVDLRSAAAAHVLQAMSVFNFSSPVGTLLIDEKSGAIRMEHYLNPQSMSMETMASVVLLFGQTADNESREIASLTGKNMGMLVR